MVPKRLFLTKGVGKHKERLTSFELALRDAASPLRTWCGFFHLSAQCKLITRKEGLNYLSPGEVFLPSSQKTHP